MGRATAYSATTSPVFVLQGLSNTLSTPDIARGLGPPRGESDRDAAARIGA
mgnify:CR=1 FL=1|jgi:hypothetical protein